MVDHFNSARTTYAGVCEEISGEIGLLLVDDTYVDEHVDLSIDTLIVDLKKEDEGKDVFGEMEEV